MVFTLQLFLIVLRTLPKRVPLKETLTMIIFSGNIILF